VKYNDIVQVNHCASQHGMECQGLVSEVRPQGHQPITRLKFFSSLPSFTHINNNIIQRTHLVETKFPAGFPQSTVNMEKIDAAAHIRNQLCIPVVIKFLLRLSYVHMDSRAVTIRL
jgi:hypothetical protein